MILRARGPFRTIGFVLSVAAIAAGIWLIAAEEKAGPSLEDLAERIVSFCRKTASRDLCYDNEISKLMDDGLSMEEAFGVLRFVQARDDGYWFCHTLGHKLSAKEYHRDPGKWRDIIKRCPTGTCSNGCLHGAIQEHFSSEAVPPEKLAGLLPELEILCEPRPGWQPTDQERSSCYHEIGHLSLYLAGADVERAIAICDRAGVKDDGRNYQQTCYEGIFMQIFQPREADDFGLIYDLVPDKRSLIECERYPAGTEKGQCWGKAWLGGGIEDFCERFPEAARNGCFRESWVARSPHDPDFETASGLIPYCDYTRTTDERYLCFNKLFYSLMSRFQFEENKMTGLCLEFKDEGLLSQCFTNSAQRMIETDTTLLDRALGLCASSPNKTVKNDCFLGLKKYVAFVFKSGSAEAVAACERFPQPWRDDCGRPL